PAPKDYFLTHLEVDCPRWDEADRLRALNAYGVLDTEREPAFDDIAQLVASVFGAPMAAVSLVDAERQWFKAEVGLGLSETPRPTSFCAHTMLGETAMVVGDATTDSRFRENPLVVSEPGIRFYAGYPLVTPQGSPLGALCVLDTQPRSDELSEVEAMALRTLANQVMTQLELRRALRDRAESEDTTQRVLEASTYIGAWEWDIVSDRVVADERFAEIYSVDAETARIGAPIAVFTASVDVLDLERVRAEIAAAMSGDGAFLSEYRLRNAAGRIRWVMARGQVYFDRDGQAIRFPGIVVDITERKKKDAALEAIAAKLSESEAQFRVLADAMPQMVWSTLPDGFHDYYNARWYEFTGVPVGSTDGEGWNDMFHPDDQARAWERWRQSLES
ncbi:hypothetical protein LTR94_027262, partial [Friedmanniomyces endolithicus]